MFDYNCGGGDRHHLLFTLLHVPIDSKRRSADEVCMCVRVCACCDRDTLR
jgi:hypothetical protein